MKIKELRIKKLHIRTVKTIKLMSVTWYYRPYFYGRDELIKEKYINVAEWYV